MVAMKAWNPEIDWKPKDLRNCLPTFAAMRGLLNDVWEQSLGHAPRTITARHYVPRLASVSIGEASALKEQMTPFRHHVTEPLNSAIKSKLGTTNLNFFEREAPNLLTSLKSSGLSRCKSMVEPMGVEPTTS